MPCDIIMLCGISSRFQLLSPSERQVAHALLTRPPLSLPSLHPKNPIGSFVRLACVRHAASVRPEPGSNSLKYCINTGLPVSTYFRALFAQFRYWRIFFLPLWILQFQLPKLLCKSTSYFKKSRVPFPSLFNFQGSSPPALRRQLCKYTTSLLLCQEVFGSFLKFLFLNFLRGFLPLSFPKACLILSPLFSFVNTSFQPFSPFFSPFANASGRFCVPRSSLHHILYLLRFYDFMH